jgi:2-polyprenyl-3-methyl-5-hydroxy-6-metoxy-1,4-benzoquinol methylase
MMNDHTPESISSFIRQFQQIRILLTAYELDLFTSIGSYAMTSKKVAERTHADPRATDRLLNALCVLGFLDKKKNSFSNTTATKKYLVKGSPGYMSGLMHQVHLWDTWTTLTDCVREGTSVADRPESVNDRDPDYLEAFIGAMHYRARENAGEIIARIDLDKVHRVLDVGGGSGVFAMAFVRAGEDLTATVYDLPNVIPITRKYIHKEQMEGKIDTAEGDYHVDQLPAGYDIVFLSAIVHSNSHAENRQLIRKCAAALNLGGRIIIKDQVMEDSRIEPATGALFSLNMLVNTRAGDTYTEKEIRAWFDHAGIQYVETINIPGHDSMVIGRKE